MLKAIDVANYFVNSSRVLGARISNMKLNKLLYFAQGYSLSCLEKPLFEEDLQAWQHGPVAPSVYNSFKSYGPSPIEHVSGKYDASVFSDEQVDLLTAVMRKYFRYSAWALRELTHQKGTPWRQVYDENARNVVIEKKLMKEFFDTQDLSRESRPSIDVEYIGYHDKNGVLILPMDDADEG